MIGPTGQGGGTTIGEGVVRMGTPQACAGRGLAKDHNNGGSLMTPRWLGFRVATGPTLALRGVRRHRRALVFAAMSVAISLTLLVGSATAAPVPPITAYVTNSA